MGRVHMEADDVEDSDSEAGSAGMHDYPVEEMPEPPQWWQ